MSPDCTHSDRSLSAEICILGCSSHDFVNSFTGGILGIDIARVESRTLFDFSGL